MAQSEAIQALQRQIEQLQTQLNSKKSHVSTSSGGLPESKHLDGNNYADWKFQMKNFLVDAGLWNCIETASGSDLDAELDQRALAKINLSIKPTASAETKKAKTAKEAWLALQKTYEDTGVIRRIGLYSSLFRTKFEDFHSMTEYIDHITNIAEQLENIGKPLESETVGGIILGGLPDKFRPLILGIQGSNQPITIEFVKNLLLQENVKDLFSNTKASNSAFYGKSAPRFMQKQKNNDAHKQRCFNCNQIGHFSSSCRKPRRNNGKYKTENKEKPLSLFAATGDRAKLSKDWYLDSGCNNHMTARDDWLTDFRPQRNRSIDVANGESVTITGIGNVDIQLVNNSLVKATDIIHAPDLTTNLLSISQMAKKGKTIVFDPQGCRITETRVRIPQNEVLATASETNGLYKLDTSQIVAAKATVTSHDIWHRRLAHLNRRDMNLLINKMSSGISCAPDRGNTCISCLKGKQHRSPFPQSSLNHSKTVLELVHSDLCGPISTSSIGGSRYFLTFTDDHSRKSFIYFLKTKDEVRERFVEFKALVENETGKKIKILRTDNDGEYVNRDLQNYLKLSGIRHQTTVPRSPEQNGISERLNRTLVEKARTMLLDANLGKEHWAEAVNTANYLKNRSPTKAVKFKTPEEAWSKKKPDLSHLRIFGCKVMTHVPEVHRKKFDAKSEQGILVGYSEDSKGYRIFNPVTRRVHICRDVAFLENELLKDPMNEASFKNIDESSEYIVKTQVNSDAAASEDKREDADDHATRSQMNNQSEDIPEIEEENVEQSSNNWNSKRTIIPNTKYFNDDYIVYQANICLAEDPQTYEEAMKTPQVKEWRSALQNEIEAHHENNSWTYCDLPPGRKAIKSRWTFKTKYKANGQIDRLKVRLVAKGCSQKHGIDYEETFSPTVRHSSVRFLISLAANLDLDLDQMDVVTAFLHPKLDEEIYMELPENEELHGHRYCKLNKSIYGLKQASRRWYLELGQAFKETGLVKAKTDPCIFYKHEKGKILIVAVYVDDLLILSNNKEEKESLKRSLKQRFKMKDLGEAHHILGMRITRNREEGLITLDQSIYIKQMLSRFNMQDCNATNTPYASSQTLSKEMSPKNEEERREAEKYPYREAIGSLLYASLGTRPDITYAVGLASRFANNPGQAHWNAIKRIFRYLKGTVSKKLHFRKGGNLEAFSDSDWANNKDDRRSTTGYVMCQSNCAISWNSKKQPTVALSSTEAEYMALSAAAQEIIWLRQLKQEITGEKLDTTILHCDNRGAIKISSNPISSQRSKHIDIRHHFIREKIDEGHVELVPIDSENNAADALTKPVTLEQLNRCCKTFGLS